MTKTQLQKRTLFSTILRKMNKLSGTLQDNREQETSRIANLQFSIYNGIFNVLNFNGNFNTAIRTLALCLPRFPYADKREYIWKDTPPLSLVLHPFIKSIVNSLSFITPILTLTSEHKAIYELPDTIAIYGKLKLNFIKRSIATWETKCLLSTENGILKLEVKSSNNLIIKSTSLSC